MTGNASGRRFDFDRMLARRQADIDQQLEDLVDVRKQLDQRMAHLRAEMDVARLEFERAIARGAEPLKAAGKYRDRFGSWPEFKRRKRPPRGPDIEPAPVNPRPKPTPLVGGAEAPIE